MSDSEFDYLASQLLKDIGVQDSTTLNFFQTRPLSSEWKSSIKVPSARSPPKHRRTGSSGTARTRQTAREGQQNGTQRKLSNEQNGASNLPRKLSGDLNGSRKLSSEQNGSRKLSNEQNGSRKVSSEHGSINNPSRKVSGGEQTAPNHQRVHSGEKILRSPQHYSSVSSSTSGQPTVTNKQSGGHDGRFGYGGSANAANRTHTQPVRSHLLGMYLILL